MLIQLTTLMAGILLLANSATGLATEHQPNLLQGTVSFAQDLVIDVEIAANREQREHGLMGRETLPAKQGMLFVYPDQAERAVWMRNTLLPLDVLFLSAESKIVSILKNLQPCRQQSCPIYSSKAQATYMLEVNAGFVEQNHLAIGQELRLEYRHPAH